MRKNRMLLDGRGWAHCCHCYNLIPCPFALQMKIEYRVWAQEVP